MTLQRHKVANRVEGTGFGWSPILIEREKQMVEFLAEEKHGFYVDFELRAEEDREQSMKQGMPAFLKTLNLRLLPCRGRSGG
jgi:hypothetical protein